MVTEKTPKRVYKRRIKGVFLQFVTGDGRSEGGIGNAEGGDWKGEVGMRDGEKGLKAESSKLKVGDRRRNSECGMGNAELGPVVVLNKRRSSVFAVASTRQDAAAIYAASGLSELKALPSGLEALRAGSGAGSQNVSSSSK
jgi:hypothetical protein